MIKTYETFLNEGIMDKFFLKFKNALLWKNTTAGIFMMNYFDIEHSSISKQDREIFSKYGIESSKKEGETVDKDIAPYWVDLIDKLDKNRTVFSKIRDKFLTYIKREDRDKFEIALNNMYTWHQKNQDHSSNTDLQKDIYSILKYMENQKDKEIECTKNGLVKLNNTHRSDALLKYKYDLISYTYENDSISIEIYMSRSMNDEIAFNFHVYQPVSNINDFKSMLAYFATKENVGTIIPFVINKITYKND